MAFLTLKQSQVPLIQLVRRDDEWQRPRFRPLLCTAGGQEGLRCGDTGKWNVCSVHLGFSPLTILKNKASAPSFLVFFIVAVTRFLKC